MKDVTIYTTPTCHFCKAAKAFFAEHNVEFINKDVTTNKEFANEMINKSGQMGVPVTFIDNDMVIGFDEPKLRELLGIK
ncbi:MAG: glutaredoxin family protein [Candidatus Zambryskibacteria bacterium]|nr:glutaredoxin family protein [Candidatus Zambryskibacteria bacterium]